MAYDILPSTNYTHRGNLFLVIQHKIPCGITAIKHSSDLFPPPRTQRADIPGTLLSP